MGSRARRFRLYRVTDHASKNRVRFLSRAAGRHKPIPELRVDHEVHASRSGVGLPPVLRLQCLPHFWVSLVMPYSIDPFESF